MFDSEGKRKYMNDAERKAFFRVMARQPDALLQSFCLTLLYTGYRISEALHVTAGNIDLSQKCIVFETLKRRQRGLFRSVPVPDNMVAVFRELVHEVEPGRRVWPFSRATAFRLIRDMANEAGVKGTMACPKGLRHGFAVACIGQNIPLTTVQKWLGHARLETTAIYLGVSGAEERNFARRLWFKP